MASRGTRLLVLAASLTTTMAIAAGATPHAPTIEAQGPRSLPAGLAASAVAAAGSSYLPGTVVIREGAELSFLNVDASRHSVTSKTTDHDGLPAFDSGIVGFTGRAVVEGVTSLKASVQGYAFFCQMHPWMQGTLIVLE